jgi:hypothetical protein
MENQTLRLIFRTAILVPVTWIALWALYFNFPIFGLSQNTRGHNIAPRDRAVLTQVLGSEVTRQMDDFIYFNTKSEGFDRATVRIEYKNLLPDQQIHVGFKDRPNWHFATKPVSLPLIDSLGWIQVNTTPPILFTREYKYASYDEFILDPPREEPVGTYYTSASLDINYLPDYKKSGVWTNLATPLRGGHTIYVYLENEPFSLKINKHDLNRYEGEDELKIQVFKDDVFLFEETIPDDGTADMSGQSHQSQEKVVQYNGGFPETGAYKIVFIADGEIIIDSIMTSLSKIVFKGHIFPMQSATLYTDAREMTFRTAHTSSLGPVFINGNPLNIGTTGKEHKFSSGTHYNVLDLPKGDITVNGSGYFAFSKDQYFTPHIFNKVDISSLKDLNNVDYLLTDYVHPKTGTDGWKIAELEFDLHTAVHTKDGLNWIIKAPGLKDRSGEILINDIEVILHKDPIL